VALLPFGSGCLLLSAPLPGYPFTSASVWLQSVELAPVAENSDAMVKRLAASVTDRYDGVAAFNVRQYNNNYYVADRNTPRVDVAFDDCQDKGYLPQGLTGPGGQFEDVPIPVGAIPAEGTDKMMSVYSPTSDQLWEFWRIEQSPDGRWRACWGGRLDSASTGPGYFEDPFGATATGLSATGGMVSLADVRSGTIDHALSLVVPDPAGPDRFSWPAQRSDGWNPAPDAVPEGTRLRLDPSIDVDALDLTPVAAMIARASQRYGFIVADAGGAVAVIAEGGAAEASSTGRDPWIDILGSTPSYRVLENFPWERLEALPPDHGRPARATGADG
jgi:hypothetical protein